MAHYKITDGDKFVGVCSSEDFRTYQAKHDILLISDENHGQYVQHNEVLYRDKWFVPLLTDKIEYLDATVSIITDKEYNTLAEAIEKDENLDELLRAEEPEEEPVVEEEIPVEEELTADYVREVKLKEMSLACREAIEDGFSLDFGDGVDHHFSMKQTDQINLLDAFNQILSGESEIVYHADGEDMKLFSAKEMKEIIGAANRHKLYHLAYYNSLKDWLNGLNRISNISDVQYGDEIPKKYQSAVYKKYVNDVQ